MKKIVSVVIALIIVCSVCFTAVFAASNTAALTAKSNVSKANVGDTVKVTVDLSANSDLGALTFYLKYDSSCYEYVKGSLKAGGLFAMEEINDKTAGSLKYTAMTGTSVNAAGTLITAEFKVLKTNSAFSVLVDEAWDSGDNDITSAVASRSKGVTVACAHGKTEEKVTAQPTHTANGTKSVVCSYCGTTVKTESIPATGHTFGAWTVTKAATCTEKGTETRTCSCGAKETRDIAVKSHTAGNWTVKTAPTCENKGIEVQKCTTCGTELNTREIAAKGHTFGEWNIVKDATCTEKGEKKAVCTVCGKAVTEKIAAKGHTHGEWTVIKDATCTEKGLKGSECTVCGEKYTEEIAAKGHTPSEWTVVKDATCTADGEKKSVCTVCGEEYTEAIPALGHKFGEWKVVKEATDTAEGQEERVCSVCGEKETNVLEKLTPKPEDPQKPQIPNTAENAVVYATLSVLGVTALFAIVGVSVYKLRKKQLVED